MTGEVYKGVYETLEKKGKFPKVPFMEYPKIIMLKNGSRVTVNNQVEELRMIDEVVPVVNVAKLEADKANVEKLLADAEARMKELEAQIKAKADEKVPVEAPAAPIIAPVPPPASKPKS